MQGQYINSHLFLGALKGLTSRHSKTKTEGRSGRLCVEARSLRAPADLLEHSPSQQVTGLHSGYEAVIGVILWRVFLLLFFLAAFKRAVKRLHCYCEERLALCLPLNSGMEQNWATTFCWNRDRSIFAGFGLGLMPQNWINPTALQILVEKRMGRKEFPTGSSHCVYSYACQEVLLLTIKVVLGNQTHINNLSN